LKTYVFTRLVARAKTITYTQTCKEENNLTNNNNSSSNNYNN